MNQEMDQTATRIQENKNPSPIFNNGVTTPTPPLTPISRSDTANNNPYPTTFVQADTSSFKQVVQMLTGSTQTAKQASQDPPLTPTSSSSTRNFAIPPIKTTPKKQQQQQNSFKLYERRNNYHLQNSLMINTLLPSFANNNNSNSFSPREILSPSLLEFPKLTLSPVTPLNIEDPYYKNSPSPSLANSSSSEEERAIAEKGFYLHPSPISTPRDSEPQLLPLFPLTSPRISGSSS